MKENLNTPLLFPHGEQVLSLIPQIPSTINARDRLGHPLAIEFYGFNALQALRELQREDYVTFMIYVLEYKLMVLEQESEIKEKAYLEQFNYEPPYTPSGYGVLEQHCYLRDFKGFNISDAFKCKAVLDWILPICLDFYPETMFKSHMVNVPFGFTAFFNFISLFLDAQ